MKLHRYAFSCLLGLVSNGCDDTSGSDTDAHQNPGGKADDANEADVDARAREVYRRILANPNPDHQNIVSEDAFAFLIGAGMGSVHIDFHTLRRWYLLRQDTREALMANDKDGSQLLQEGDPASGLEFCAMHGAMIELLSNAFPCDPKIERSCLSEFGVETDSIDRNASVFAGWGSDAELLAQLGARGVPEAHIERARAAIETIDAALVEDESGLDAFERIAADPTSGITSPDDALCLFMQTTIRLGDWQERQAALERGAIGPDSDARFYKQTSEQAVGIHNALHGMLMKPGSFIDVGDPSKNLSNAVFWGIHGWVEFKWRQARKQWHPDCGDAPGKLWRDGWNPQTDGEEIVAACGETYFDEIIKWGVHHQLHGGASVEPEAGTLGATCSTTAKCHDGLACASTDELGSLCVPAVRRGVGAARTPEGVDPTQLFSLAPVDESSCSPGETGCGTPLAPLGADHPSLP